MNSMSGDITATTVRLDITTVFVIAAILIVVIMIYKDWSANISNKDKDKEEEQKKIKENYAPNIDGDFNQYAPARDPRMYYPPQPSIGWLSRRGLLPWWNSTRDTKNMSYDIRGDVPPFRYPVGPWLNSTIVDYPYSYREIY